MNSSGLNVTEDHAFGNSTNRSSDGNSSIYPDYDFEDMDRLRFAVDRSFDAINAVAILGNILLTIVIYKTSKLKDTPGRLLINNTIPDTLASTVYIVLPLYQMFSTFSEYTDAVVISLRVMGSVFIAVSDQTLAIVMFTLHIAICNPITYKLHCRGKYVACVLIALWAFNLILSSSVLFVEDVGDLNKIFGNLLMSSRKHFELFAILKFLFHQVLPFLTILVCYLRISLHVKSARRTDVFQQSLNSSHIRQANAVILIYTTYFLTQLPMIIFEFLTVVVLSEERDIYFQLHLAFIYLAYAYVVFKLPLFLIAFKSFGRTAMAICGRVRSEVAGARSTSTTDTEPRVKTCDIQNVAYIAKPNMGMVSGQAGRVNGGFDHHE